MVEEASAVIRDYRHGRLDEGAVRRFVRDRDAAGGLEVDSATFNHAYAHILVTEFPDARFLLLFREPAAWIESILGQGWHKYRLVQGEGRTLPAGYLYFGKLMGGPTFEPEVLESLETLRPVLAAMAVPALRYWREVHEELLEVVPPERRLLMNTAELSFSLLRLAAFAGVSISDLDPSSDHLHKREESDPLLEGLDPEWFAEAVERESGETWQKLNRLARQEGER